MRNHRRHVLFAAALVLTVTFAAPTVEAGGAFGLHIGSGGFGVSVGFGDWGVYTSSWADPYWSINFNATLAGYGQWTWVNGLGRVWRPWVATSWRPYTHGRWVSTGYGWTWVAYEPWGYIPHHYGNWAYSSFGWVWVPGYTYTAANVVWVGAGGYVGWYARPPWGWSHAHHGFHHGYRHGYDNGWGNGYRSGYSDGWRDARYATYVDWRHFGTENVSRRSVTHRIASSNRIEGLGDGPTQAEIRRRGGSTVPEAQISRRTVTMGGREITIARPEGVARSIERNAADTVGSALSRQALEQRQPMVRPRSVDAARESGRSGPGSTSNRTGSPPVDRSSREYSSRSRQPASQSYATRERRVDTGRSDPRSPDANTSSRINARQQGTDPRQMSPRRTDEIGFVGDRGSRRAPSASQRSQTSSESRQRATSSRRTNASQSRQSQARRSTAGSQPPQTQRRAVESRRSPQRSQQPRATRSRSNSDGKEKEPTARRRKR